MNRRRVVWPGRRILLFLIHESALPVMDVLKPFLIAAALIWRRVLLGTKFIAITGSAGKSTCKECLAAILESRGRTFRLHGNQNTPWLVAANVLRVRPWHRFAVFELSGALPGWLRIMGRLTRPDLVLLLNVARTHTLSYRNPDDCAREKTSLLEELRPGGVAVLNGDDPRLRDASGGKAGRLFLFGTQDRFDLWAEEVSARWPERLTFRAHSGSREVRVRTNLVGAHWLDTALAALLAGTLCGAGLEDAAAALERVPPFPGRLEPFPLPNGAVVLRDEYNAAADLLEASLRVLAGARAERRWLVITDFSDFGKNRRRRLKHLARMCVRSCDRYVLIGEDYEYGKRRAIEEGFPAGRVTGFSRQEEAAVFLKRELAAGDLVLIKGSTNHHTGRITLAQIGTVSCWIPSCRRHILCDNCWKAGPVVRRLPGLI